MELGPIEADGRLKSHNVIEDIPTEEEIAQQEIAQEVANPRCQVYDHPRT